MFVSLTFDNSLFALQSGEILLLDFSYYNFVNYTFPTGVFLNLKHLHERKAFIPDNLW